jgi:hypothetical protein
MLLTWHIVRKDLRRLWPWLALLVGAMLARYANLYAPRFDPERARLAELWNRAEIIDNLFLGLSLLASALIAAALVHQDAVTGDRPFWLTRPISGGRMLASKSLTFALTLLLVPTAIQVGWWLSQHYSIADIAAQFPSIALRQAGVAFAAFCLALLTRNLGAFILTAIVTTLALVVTHALLIDQWLRLPLRADEFTRLRVELIAAAILLPLLVAHQYLTRNTRRTLFFFGGAVALCLTLYATWSLSLFEKIERPPALASDPAISATATLPVPDFHRQRTSGGNARKSRTDLVPVFTSQLTLGPIPAGHALQILSTNLTPKRPLVLRERQVTLPLPQYPLPYFSTDKLFVFDPSQETPPEIPESFEATFTLALRKPQITVTLPVVVDAAGSYGPHRVRIAATKNIRGVTRSMYAFPDGSKGSVEEGATEKRFALMLDEIRPFFLLSTDSAYAEHDFDAYYYRDPGSLYGGEGGSRHAYFLVSRHDGSALPADNIYVDRTLSVDGVRRRMIRVEFPTHLEESQLAGYDLVKVIAPLVGTFTRTIRFPASRWTEPPAPESR